MIPYPALDSRLSALEEDLNIVLSGLEKVDRDLRDLGTGGFNERSLREILVNNIRILTKRIRDLRQAPAAKSITELWIQYGDLRDQSDQVYREFLEIVGGVAIRTREIDEKICLIAQELVRGAAVDPPRLTILATGDGIASKGARLMRIRFSDRAVWTLPLAAHQFAHLLIEDCDEFYQFIKNKAEAEVPPTLPVGTQAAADSELQVKSAMLRRKHVEAAASRWKKLIADGIAIYIVGPCYAASALVFRLNPVAGLSDGDGQAGDIERAYVCLEMLRKLDEPAGGAYQDFIDWLERLWEKMLEDAGSSKILDAARKTLLNQFVGDLYNSLGENFPAAQYPWTTDKDLPEMGGWSVANQWAQGWRQGLAAASGRLMVPKDVSGSSKVRDALNAAWICRSIFDPGKFPVLTQVVRETCDKIISERFRSPDEQVAAAAGQGPSGSRSR
jgi:hypothetical protein